MTTYCLQIGADPNSTSDTGRSPLWRAAFNGHVEVQFSSFALYIAFALSFGMLVQRQTLMWTLYCVNI